MKKYLIWFIIGALVFGTSVYAVISYLYSSNEVSYTPSDSSWSVGNVKEALDNLKTTSLLVKPSGTKSITSNGSNIDVSGYASVNVNVSQKFFLVIILTLERIIIIQLFLLCGL